MQRGIAEIRYKSGVEISSTLPYNGLPSASERGDFELPHAEEDLEFKSFAQGFPPWSY